MFIIHVHVTNIIFIQCYWCEMLRMFLLELRHEKTNNVVSDLNGSDTNKAVQAFGLAYADCWFSHEVAQMCLVL